jgi:hypothetical protein
LLLQNDVLSSTSITILYFDRRESLWPCFGYVEPSLKEENKYGRILVYFIQNTAILNEL